MFFFTFSGTRSGPPPPPKPNQNLSLADQLALRGTDLKSGSKRGPPPPPKAPEPMSLLDQIRAGKNLKKAEERKRLCKKTVCGYKTLDLESISIISDKVIIHQVEPFSRI